MFHSQLNYFSKTKTIFSTVYTVFTTVNTLLNGMRVILAHQYRAPESENVNSNTILVTFGYISCDS